MSEKHTPDKMLLRLIRVAEILAKAEVQNPSNIGQVKDLKQLGKKSQDLSTEHTKH
jgi:hypothetical protein